MRRNISLVILVAAIAISLLAAAAIFTLSKIEKEARLETGIALQTILTTSRQAFRIWADEIRRETQVWAQTSSVKALARELLNVERTQASLLGSPAQERLRNFLEPVYRGKGYLGFFVIAPDNISLASARDINTGEKNPLSNQPSFLSRIFSGETALSIPQLSEVPLLDDSGEMRTGVPTMFVGAPVLDDKGTVIAILAFRVDPRANFTTLFQRGRLGQTGETYAFNRDANLITESRFDSQLRDIGLIGSGQRGILNVALRDPGVNLVVGERPLDSRDQQPLTVMAERAISGETGMNLEGYRDYRGVDVIGAWLWDEEYGIGITTEIDTAEVDSYLVTTRAAFIGFALVAGLTLIGLAFASEYNRRRIVRAHEALNSAQQEYSELFENANDSIFILDPDSKRILDANLNASEQLGYTHNELLDLAITDIDEGRWQEPTNEAGRQHSESGALASESTYRRKDGSHLSVEVRSRIIGPNPQQVVQCIVHDISKRKQTDAMLHQAQKMEAVGQLTGGVAHDFNNLLAVILGNVELLEDDIGDNQMLATINRAGTRGAELTQRLLAFSRQQALQPRSINLAELVSGLDGLFQRTLGEPVKILTHVPEEVWPVFADPGQLENALLNLSINARDAMPNGGVLEIWCSNIELREGDMRVGGEVAAGDYVQVAVRDTGIGMTEDTIERAFEPFYTTKDVGAGTGLGLSMVYGFALQSGGDAVIESDLGTGTEVKIFLPRSEVINASEEHTPDDDLKRGQGEAILVLEDDPDVRTLAVAALDGLGYRVLEAADANAAMRVLEEEADNIDLLLSDVVLPGGVSGPEFAAKTKDLYPKLKIVFMTGYASGLDATEKILDIGEALLNKPFRRADLATVIHDTLAA